VEQHAGRLARAHALRGADGGSTPARTTIRYRFAESQPVSQMAESPLGTICPCSPVISALIATAARRHAERWRMTSLMMVLTGFLRGGRSTPRRRAGQRPVVA
ncbi:MAG: hypothetical protein F6Q13_19290, partial [Mycobacterium sp.]